jgi:hypothetical protein
VWNNLKKELEYKKIHITPNENWAVAAQIFHATSVALSGSWAKS